MSQRPFKKDRTFIDIAHAHIKNGDIDSTPTHLFREQFTANIRDFLDVSPDSIVLIVPSIRDIINDHAVFPQREFSAMLQAILYVFRDL